MRDELAVAFDEHLSYYKSQHRTAGCKITHMIGIPIIVASIPMFLLNRRIASQMQTLGWTLQFIGHYVFEHNKPVFLETRDPLTAFAAVKFVCDEWAKVMKGEPITDEKAVSVSYKPVSD